MKNTSLMTFPCDFPIKIVGTYTDTFELDIVTITRKHFPDTKQKKIQSRMSQQGNYLSISIVLYVENQLTLDNLYIELSKHPDVKMVL